MNEQRKDHSHTPLPAPESTDVRMHSPSAEKRLHTPDSHPSKMLASPPSAPKRAQDEKAQGGAVAAALATAATPHRPTPPPPKLPPTDARRLR